MMHIFANDDGEMIIASTLDEAARYHDCQLGGAIEPLPGWYQILDEKNITIQLDMESKTKTAKEWASEYDKTTQIATTYF